MNPLPPTPFICGSIMFSVAPTATAASIAVPPFISTCNPAIAASGWPAVTSPCTPGTAGRWAASGRPRAAPSSGSCPRTAIVAAAATAIAPPHAINRRMSSPFDKPFEAWTRRGSCSLFHSEREQDVASRAVAKFRVARRDEQHASGDHGPGGVDVAAFRRDAVHRLELAGGVELPQRLPVGGAVGEHGPGARPEEQHAGNDRHRCAATLRRRSAPRDLAAL